MRCSLQDKCEVLNLRFLDIFCLSVVRSRGRCSEELGYRCVVFILVGEVFEFQCFLFLRGGVLFWYLEFILVRGIEGNLSIFRRLRCLGRMYEVGRGGVWIQIYLYCLVTVGRVRGQLILIRFSGRVGIFGCGVVCWGCVWRMSSLTRGCYRSSELSEQNRLG